MTTEAKTRAPLERFSAPEYTDQTGTKPGLKRHLRASKGILVVPEITTELQDEHPDHKLITEEAFEAALQPEPAPKKSS